MNKLYLTLLFLFFFLGLTQAEEKKRIVFNTTEWDFGLIGSGQEGPVSHTFRMKNVSKESVKIGNLVPSCSCVIAKMSDKTLSPGEEGELEFILSPTATPGMTFRTVDVYDHKGTHLAQLSVYAEVKTVSNDLRQQYPILLDPSLLADREELLFGYVHWGKESVRNIAIANPTSKEIRLKIAVEGTEHAPISLDYPEMLRPGGTAQIHVKYAVPANYGKYSSFNNTLILYLNGQRAAKGIKANCLIMNEIPKTESTPSLWSTPSLASMEYKFFSRHYRGEIKLGNSGKAPLKILGVESNAETNLKAGDLIRPGESIMVEAISSRQGDVRIEVFTNDPMRPYKELLYTNKE